MTMHTMPASAIESIINPKVATSSPPVLQVVSKPPDGWIRTVDHMTATDSTHGGEVLLVADGGRAAGRIDALLRDAGFAVRPIDPWDEDGTAVHLGVTSLPTALLVRDGEIVTRLTSTRQRAVDRFFAAAARSSSGDAPSRGVRLQRASTYLRHLTTAGRLPDLAGA